MELRFCQMWLILAQFYSNEDVGYFKKDACILMIPNSRIQLISCEMN